MAGDAKPYDRSKDRVDTMLGQREEISIFGPLAFWILMLIIGLVVSIAVPALASAASALMHYTIPSGGAAATGMGAGGYLLGVPGIYIFPLIVGIWLGERIGRVARGSGEAIKLGLLNAIYASIVYAVTAFIIYLVINYVDQQLLSSLGLFSGTTSFALYVVGLPVIAVLILAPLFGIISSARRVHA